MDDIQAWWSKRRRTYNVTLLVAGLVAFALYGLEVDYLFPRNPHLEVTPFTMAFQALGYLIFLAVANLAFGLGIVGERLIKPGDPRAFRVTLLSLGTALSVAVPLAVPVLVILLGHRQ